MTVPNISIDGIDPSQFALGSVPPKAYTELGATGLRRWGGYVDEEFLPQLRGRKAVQVFKEMSENDPIIGALLYAIDMLLREVTWSVNPASSSFEDQMAAVFVEQCMDDMAHTWDAFISEVLTMLVYGWSWHEVVYKRRVGDVRNPEFRSKFSDGLIGWRKIPIRAQETMMQWEFDDDGGVQAMIQLAPPHYERVEIPIAKSLLFRPTAHKNNPEGRSFLRNAYRPWFFKKRIEEYEGIGIERDLAGLPVAKVPAEVMEAKPGTDRYEIQKAFKDMVKKVRRDEQEGIVLPQAFDDNGQPLYDFALLASGGQRQFDTNAIIQRYEQRILMTVLADFILVGHEDTGSYALHTDKTGIFRAAMNSITNSIAAVINRYELPRLFALNGFHLQNLPEIIPGEVDPPDLTELGAFMLQMSQVGMPMFPDPELEEFIRKAAKLPPKSESADWMQAQQIAQEAATQAAMNAIGNADQYYSEGPGGGFDATQGMVSGLLPSEQMGMQ